MASQIEVVISPTAEVRVLTKGFAGAECIGASKFLEQALGVVAEDRKTAEFFQAAESQQQMHQ